MGVYACVCGWLKVLLEFKLEPNQFLFLALDTAFLDQPHLVLSKPTSQTITALCLLIYLSDEVCVKNESARKRNDICTRFISDES